MTRVCESAHLPAPLSAVTGQITGGTAVGDSGERRTSNPFRSLMNLTPRCPNCKTRNPVTPDGRVICQRCGAHYQVLFEESGAGNAGAGQAANAWSPSRHPSFLGISLTPRNYIVGGIAVLIFFIAFWFILHLVVGRQIASKAPHPAAVSSDAVSDSDTAPPAAVQQPQPASPVSPAAVTPPPPSTRPAAPGAGHCAAAAPSRSAGSGTG